MTKSTYFKLHELLPKELYYNEEVGWGWLDERLIEVLDWLRRTAGVPLIVNNWKWGGKRNYCGARIPASPDYSYGSRHTLIPDRKVMAADVISTKITAAQLRNLIRRMKDSLPHPVRIEKNVTWLHIDVDNTSYNPIYEF